MNPTKRQRRQVSLARHFWLACGLALALLSFQTLGHLHRHFHVYGHVSLNGHAGPTAQASMLAAASLSAQDGWGHQVGDLSCQLFDQLSQDQVPAGLSDFGATAPAPLQPVAALWAQLALQPYWKHGARGPPVQA